MTMFAPRRALRLDIAAESPTLDPAELEAWESLDQLYRSLCTILYNYVPTSGHPGGSISSGRFAQALVFEGMDYDLGRPNLDRADLLSYAAGHKALGLYALWALRNEIARIAAPGLLPRDPAHQLRLEDLLGFRKNPRSPGPLFQQFQAKALDGHPTPATPFVRLATGASGVGLAASVGLALGALDTYRSDPPRIHVVEGEGGLTPGRVAEALACAATSGLRNLVVHLDWNQASIDSNRVTREGEAAGDYVQWEPWELFHLHDWNVISVADGMDFRQVLAAQRRARTLRNSQPTAIVYRTTKGWRYGIEGRASHGAGHPLCAPGFYEALRPQAGLEPPICDRQDPRCAFGSRPEVVEACYWEALQSIRRLLESNRPLVEHFAAKLRAASGRLESRVPGPSPAAPRLERVYEGISEMPKFLSLATGSSTTLRGQLGRVLGHLNQASGGALLAASADLLASTSLDEVLKGFPTGFFHAAHNPLSRTLSAGGICEDAMAGILAGLGAYGRHIGVGSSYAAFLAPLAHIAARLHAIGSQARQGVDPGPFHPFVLVCGHAGLKTGEDGPTHADPQPLQLLQENFPKGTCLTLTPWDPQEIWPLMAAALKVRPAVIAPFVTRPSERVLDRTTLGLAPAEEASRGVYLLRKAEGEPDGTLVLQESGVAYAFLQQALPRLAALGLDLDVHYVASVELFDLLPEDEQRRRLPASDAMGITGFTLPTLYRWVRSEAGRSHSLHPFRHGHFLGSGPGERVIAEAGLDGDGQVEAIQRYVEARAAERRRGRVIWTARELIHHEDTKKS